MRRRHPLARNPRLSLRGFTLLEVMVVVVIIGVVVSFAALSLKGGGTNLEEEAQRLQALIALTGQEAVWQNRELAVEFTPEGYDFLAYDGEQWQALNDDEVFRRRSLPEGLVLDYQAEGLDMTIGAKDEESFPPRIYFLSSGEATPFNITVRRRGEGGGFILVGDMRGKTRLSGAGDER